MDPQKLEELLKPIDPVGGNQAKPLKSSGRGKHPNSRKNLLSLQGKSKGNPNWFRGCVAPYAQFLANLTPEQREEYHRRRKEDHRLLTMRDQMLDIFRQHNDKWTIMLEEAVMSVLNRAIEQGDPQALNSVWDRVVGRPEAVMDVKVKQDDDVNTILQKLQSTVVVEAIEVNKEEKTDGKE